MKRTAILSALTMLILLGAQTAPAQTSVGFADPDDTTALLEYRLPDWGYRTWDLGFELSGRGYDAHGDNRQVSGGVNLGLESAWSFVHEGEDRAWNLDLTGDLAYHRNRYGNEGGESSFRSFTGNTAVLGDWRDYFGEGELFYGVEGRYAREYSEAKGDDGLILDPPAWDYERTGDGRIAVTIGAGRLRDVAPLIRAARLSERLQALGRPGLDHGAIVRLAEVLAKEHGYRTVFERPDRRFWQDALGPALEGQDPLSPFEIMYLAEVLNEDVGVRREGWQVRAGASFSEYRRTVDGLTSSSVYKGPVAGLNWSRNPSLHHQLRVDATLSYGVSGHGIVQEDLVNARLAAQHLWDVADRCLLTTDLTLNGYYREWDRTGGPRGITRSGNVGVDSDLRVRLEDSLAMIATVRGSYQMNRGDDPGEYTHAWSWDYRLSFDYALDRLLY